MCRCAGGEAARHSVGDRSEVGIRAIRHDVSREDGDGVRRVFATYETNDEEDENAWDDCEYVDQKTGEHLDPELARRARSEEIQFMKKISLFEEVPIEQCWEMIGKAPISTKWVDVNKGTVDKPDVR